MLDGRLAGEWSIGGSGPEPANMKQAKRPEGPAEMQPHPADWPGRFRYWPARDFGSGSRNCSAFISRGQSQQTPTNQPSPTIETPAPSGNQNSQTGPDGWPSWFIDGQLSGQDRVYLHS
ncbi:hypothetical protein SCAR479_01332 [Seiridium cardinale]|uniref:Uncharacterized protein n=1 Tax=Seiridium cardinale TaxID=138064 RepID=A0ABR2Y5H6_9PEZI